MNCWGICVFLDKFNSNDLLNRVNVFIEENFVEVVNCDEFLMFFFLYLGDFLMDDEIVVLCEEDFYEFFLKWV